MANRLDTYLTLNNMLPSRSKAQELISKGKILVNNKVVTKASYDVKEIDIVTVLEDELLTYVSRGGLKLEKAIKLFNIDVSRLVCCDIGASTGGFTDCLLTFNAKKVYAIDVGTNQLADKLKNDNRVISLENTNFKDVTIDTFKDKIDLYVCDVSFISIETIIKHLNEFDSDFHMVILYKPQFEVGPNNLNHNGVVKSSNIIKEYLNRFVEFLKILNIGIINFTYSPIKGQKEGNIEYLFELKNNYKNTNINIEKTVNDSYKELKVK